MGYWTHELAEDLLKRLDRVERKQAILEARGYWRASFLNCTNTNTIVEEGRDGRTTGTLAAGIGLGRVFFLPMLSAIWRKRQMTCN